jgi:hypothetical protein
MGASGADLRVRPAMAAVGASEIADLSIQRLVQGG